MWENSFFDFMKVLEMHISSSLGQSQPLGIKKFVSWLSLFSISLNLLTIFLPQHFHQLMKCFSVQLTNIGLLVRHKCSAGRSAHIRLVYTLFESTGGKGFCLQKIHGDVMFLKHFLLILLRMLRCNSIYKLKNKNYPCFKTSSNL